MDILDIILLTLSLSIDNFAVSAASSCGGGKAGRAQSAKAALSFSLTGLIFLSAGYYGGGKLLKFISSWDHIIGPLILFYLGAKMIKGAFSKRDDSPVCRNMNSLKVLLALAVATNIDVLAAGVSIAALEVKIMAVALFLFLFVNSAVLIGFGLGAKLGGRLGDKTEAAGGIVLILLSLKIFLEG